MNVGATLFGPRAAGPDLGDIEEYDNYIRNVCYRDCYLEAMPRRFCYVGLLNDIAFYIFNPMFPTRIMCHREIKTGIKIK